MPKYIIERNIPHAGDKTPGDWRQPAKQSCAVLDELAPKVQWVQSYVTGDKMYCVYIATDEAVVREHARIAGFPADRVSRVTAIIDPTTSEG